MDLNLDVARLTGRGRKPAPLSGEVVRELREDDLGLLASQGVQPPELKTITQRHHRLARLLASGVKTGEAAAACGLTNSRVSVLKTSPAFKELLELYADNTEAQYLDMHAKLSGISADALDALQDRLESDPEALSVGQLMELVKVGADRSGYGPTSKQETTVNVNLSARLDAARLRAKELQQSRSLGLEERMLDITPSRSGFEEEK